MKYCVNCGAKLYEKADFCTKCGCKTKSSSSDSFSFKTRQTEYAGKLIKCVNCGEPLHFYDLNCPKCKYEVRLQNRSTAMHDFLQRYKHHENMRIESHDTINSGVTKEDRKLVALIDTFHIPNSAEDIFEFFLLAESRLDLDLLYSKPANISSEYESQKLIAQAWERMYERLYKKAQAFNINDPNLSSIIEQYHEYENKKAPYIRKVSVKKRIKYSAVLVACLICVGTVLYSVNYIKNENTEFIEDTRAIEKKIDQEKYDEAEKMIEDLEISSFVSSENEEKWNEKKEGYLRIIERSKRIKNGTETIKMPKAAKKYKGENYKDVVKQLEALGFINIELEADKDLTTGWINDDGEVESVSINGETNFKKNKKFDYEDPVTIVYHTFK